MANWTHFYAHDFAGPDWSPDDKPALDLFGRSSFPAFWFSAFHSACGCTRNLPLADGGALPVAGLIITAAEGLELAQGRKSLFESILPPELLGHYETWLELLGKHAAARFFQLDPNEVAVLLDDAQLKGWLDEAVSGVSGDKAHLLATFDNPSLDFDSSACRVTRYDPTAMPYALLGRSFD